MKTYRFYKEPDHRWYIDLPEYLEKGGDKADLEMVEGADVFLDIIARDKLNVYAKLSAEPFAGAAILHHTYTEQFSGANYRVESAYKLPSENFEMWLCDVTKFVFGGDFPENIWFWVEEVN